MRKILLIATLFILSIGILSAQQPLEEINKWAKQQTEEVNADNVVNFLKGNGDRAGGGITFGGEYVHSSIWSSYNSVTKLDESHFAVAFYNNNGYVIIGSVSGNIITYGNIFAFNYGTTDRICITSLGSA